MYKATCWRQTDLRPCAAPRVMDFSLSESCPISNAHAYSPTRSAAEVGYVSLHILSERRAFLDVPLSVEEVECIWIAEEDEAEETDDLTMEHLCYGGPTSAIWLTKVLNSVVELKWIPVAFKQGFTISVSKRGSIPWMSTATEVSHSIQQSWKSLNLLSWTGWNPFSVILVYPTQTSPRTGKVYHALM